MNQLNVLIKPSSSLCNLNCEYCFYHDVAKNRTDFSHGFMKREVLETIVKKAFQEITEGKITFSFQGGEPTLIGLGFYRYYIQLINELNKNNVQVFHNIQTNGTMIDDEWALFFHEYEFLVGISLDGVKRLHDRNRKYLNKESTFDIVMDCIERLRKHKVNFNILTVVDDELAIHISEVYAFYRKEEFGYLQFIPCLEPLNSTSLPRLSPDRYGVFLSELFSLWYQDLARGTYVSVRFFDQIISMASGEEALNCEQKGRCSIQFVIEADGSVYPCDFYSLDEYQLGNIQEQTFAQIFYSLRAQDFLMESFSDHPNCQACEYFQLCRGGCKRHQQSGIHSKIELNRFCNAYQRFFQENITKITQLAAIIQKRS